MKKVYLLGIFIAILLLAVGPAYAASQPRVIVSGFSINDGPAVGKNFVLSLNLTNVGSICARTIITSVQANSPFIMRGVSSVESGDLCWNANKMVDIPLRVDPTATGGFYQITVTNSYEDTLFMQYSHTDIINVFVNGTPDIHAHITGASPVEIYAGDTALLMVTIQNDGSFQAQALNATMTADSPLMVDWSKSFASISVLNAKQSTVADFSVEIPRNANAESYPLHLSVQYLDENLVSQAKNFDFSLSPKKKALFETSDFGSDGFYANGNSKILRLNLKNTGSDSANKIKIKLQPQFPFSTDGSSRYIESLEPGKSVPVEFIIDVDKDATIGTYNLNLLLDFEDAQGKKISETATSALTVQEKGIFRSVFIDYWFVWVVLILAVLLVFRSKMHKKKK